MDNKNFTDKCCQGDKHSEMTQNNRETKSDLTERSVWLPQRSDI